MCYFLRQPILVIAIASHLLICVYSVLGCSYDTLVLCPTFNLNVDPTCNGSLAAQGGFQITGVNLNSVEYLIVPNSGVHNVSPFDYEAFVIPGGCNVSQVTPLEIFSGTVLSSPCLTVNKDPMSNSLSFSCAVQTATEGTGIVIYTGSGGPACGFTGNALIALLGEFEVSAFAA